MTRYTIAAVIIVIVYVQCCTAAYIGHERRVNPTPDENYDATPKIHLSRNRNTITGDDNHKHLSFLKAPDPRIVETIRRRMKARLRGRRPDQSNERNQWKSHPKKEDYFGPDTDEVFGLLPSLGI